MVACPTLRQGLGICLKKMTWVEDVEGLHDGVFQEETTYMTPAAAGQKSRAYLRPEPTNNHHRRPAGPFTFIGVTSDAA